MENKKVVFKDFGEFWHYTKYLSQQQTNVVFNTLDKDRQKYLKKSYRDGGWDDLLLRNQINKTADDILEKTGIDLFLIRARVVSSNKPYFMKRKDWNFICELFAGFPKESIELVVGGIIVQDISENTVVLISESHD